MFLDLTNRSSEAELMDDPKVDKKALEIALSDVSRVNRLLGGNSITINAVFDQIDKGDKKEWVLIDLGSGDGEMLRLIADQARKRDLKLKLLGLDINDQCIAQAKELSEEYPEISYHNKDILTVSKQEFCCDILICTLTMHHLKDEEIKKVIDKSLNLVSTAIIINDLHRNSVAYILFKIFSLFFVRGYIAKNDGLVSIKRGFKRNDLLSFAKELKLKNHQLNWKWAFRYRWIIRV